MHRTGVTGAELVYKKGLEASTKKSVEMERAKHQSRSAPSGTANVVTAGSFSNMIHAKGSLEGGKIQPDISV